MSRTSGGADPASTGRSRGRALRAWILPSVVVLGTLVRLAACFNDLWFDELWTYLIARSLHSALDVFTEVRHNNNHYLNTLVFYALGEQVHGEVYRIPSLLAGLGGVLLAGAAARGWGRLEGAAAIVLASCSYLLVHYSSEARGYSSAVLFAFLGLWALRNHARTGSARDVALFWCAVVMGFLSHLEFIHFYAAAGLWSCWHSWRRWKSRAALVELVRLHCVPLAGLALLYWIDVRHMEIGGGPRYDLYEVLVETASTTLGGPASGALAIATGIVTVALALLALRQLWRRGDDLWLFFAVVLFLAPAALLLIVRNDVLFPRYFLLGSAFFLLLLAILLADLVRAGARGSWAAGLLLAVFVCGNAWRTAALLRYGRGQYLAALRTMEARSGGRDYTVGSDHDSRNGLLVEYHARRLEHPERLRYVLQTERLAPDWLILHKIGAPGVPEQTVQTPSGIRYQLERVFPYSALSGWHWFLYRREGSGPGD